MYAKNRWLIATEWQCPLLCMPLCCGGGVKCVNFEHKIVVWCLEHWSKNCSGMYNGGYHWSVNIGSGNWLVSSGNKPSPGTKVTQSYTAIWSHNELTHWGRDKTAANFLTTFSNAFSWMKIYKFRFRFYWSLFPSVQLTIFHHWFR